MHVVPSLPLLPNKQKFGWQENIQDIYATINKTTLATHFDTTTNSDTQAFTNRFMSETACNDSELDDAVLDIIDFVATSNITPMESSNTASNNNTGTLVGGLTSVTSTIRSVATSAVSVFGQVLHDFTATNTSDSHPSATMGSPATTMGSPPATCSRGACPKLSKVPMLLN